MYNFLRTIQNAGININTVYDIGAHTGQWSTQTKNAAIPNANYILFEANPIYADALSATGFKSYCGVALSNPGRKSVDFYNGSDTGDSYYKETTKHYDNQGYISLPCVTLDYLVKEASLPIPQLIKIDTQGSELDILSGAESFIREVDLVYTECPIVCYNAGAPNIQDYLNFFKAHEFVPVDIFEIHKGENIVIQIDIMFMRNKTKEKVFGKNNMIRPFI